MNVLDLDALHDASRDKRYILSDKAVGGVLHKHLRHQKNTCRKRYALLISAVRTVSLIGLILMKGKMLSIAESVLVIGKQIPLLVKIIVGR